MITDEFVSNFNLDEVKEKHKKIKAVIDRISKLSFDLENIFSQKLPQKEVKRNSQNGLTVRLTVTYEGSYDKAVETHEINLNVEGTEEVLKELVLQTAKQLNSEYSAYREAEGLSRWCSLVDCYDLRDKYKFYEHEENK